MNNAVQTVGAVVIVWSIGMHSERDATQTNKPT